MFTTNQKRKLIYRTTRDGFNVADFHSKCDNLENSLVIIKSTNGNVFGGFTEQRWSNQNEFESDRNAFLFSLKTKKIRASAHFFGYSSCIRASNELGPSFGEALNICHNSNKIKESYSEFDFTYKHPYYRHGSDEAKSYLPCSHKFITTKIEIFTK